ncbi:MAG: hypothetical protein WCC17_03115 [Candidatus Nitrosopolaris sp.]
MRFGAVMDGIDFFFLLSLMGVNLMWITIFILSIRSYYIVPAIDRRLKTARLQTIALSSFSHESIENVIGPSKNGELPNISLFAPFC